jgi:RNA polymerase sigma-70 factor (ECF subfamily)
LQLPRVIRSRRRKEDTLLQATLESHPLPHHPEMELEQMFHDHRARVFRAAYRITGNTNDAEDVLQTVFLRLARREDPGAVHNLESYLYRAAINASLDLLRSQKTGAQVSLDDVAPVDLGFSSSSLHHSADLRVWLRQAVAKLSPRHAEMFVLRYLEGYDNREIARMLDTSQAVVAVTLHRTRGQLQKEFRSFEKRKN